MKYIASVIAVCSVHLLYAQEVINLYDGVAPGSDSWTWKEGVYEPGPGRTMLYNVIEPEITYYRAADSLRTGAAMLVAPGGAFHILSIENEGNQVAEFLNGLGIDAFVLKYRLSRTYSDNPMEELRPLMRNSEKLDSINAPIVEMATQDGIKALEYMHQNAQKLGLDTAKVGMIGFSAGGTLTMSVLLSAPQEIKPDLVAPIYLYKPAVIGDSYPTATTPMFIAVASDDALKFVPHSIDLYQEWIQEGHPTELHIYESGDHGFGMAPKGTASDQWPSDFTNWLEQRSWLGHKEDTN